tara:strand:- start:169 stop:417 length:249 start_codon:yes stop_codon:yes gene_type:complete
MGDTRTAPIQQAWTVDAMGVSIKEKNHQVSIEAGGWVTTGNQGNKKRAGLMPRSFSLGGKQFSVAGQPGEKAVRVAWVLGMA